MTDEAKRLKAFRKAFGITQKDIGDDVGVSQKSLSRWELGENPIPLDLVKKMHLKYGLNYVWFFHGNGKMKHDVVEKRSTLHDLKEVLLENAILKEKIAKLEANFNELHTAFYAFKYQSKA